MTGAARYIWLLFYGLLVSIHCVSAQSTCGWIGTNSTTPTTASIQQLFVLNMLEPATCDGTISNYQYCYYPLMNKISSNKEISLSFEFAVYRSINDSYRKMSDSIFVAQTEVTVKQICVTGYFSDPISVDKGDVLGACVNISADDASTQVSPIGNNSNSNVYLLTAGINLCSGSIPPSIPRQSLTETRGLVLHLSATVLSRTNSGLIAEEIVAIVVPLAAIAIIAVVIIVIYWSCKRRHSISPFASTEPLLPQNPGYDNAMYYDVSIMRGGHQYKSRADSGTYEAVDSPESSTQFHTPILSDNSAPDDTRIDSGSYAVVRHTSVHNRAALVSPRENREDMEASQRHVYELEISSRTRGCSFECSYEDVNHYEPMYPGMEYLDPLQATEKPVTITQLLEMNKEEDIYSEVRPFQRPASIEVDLMSQLKSWDIRTLARDTIDVQLDIGTGQFGTVKEGVWQEEDGRSTKVALKSLKHDCAPDDKLKFLQEAAIMAQFRHPNIIMVFGVVVESQPMMIVVELATKGDLRNHLISIRPDPNEKPPEGLSKTFLEFSQQVALGMQYLSAKGFVHRDLAARNILLSKKNVCKVADFGMSRDLADESYYVSHGGVIPVKWTAPEAIHYKKYSTASDVWAYGCLLYEIWSLGHKPFESLTNIQALRVLEVGTRLSPPPGCPKMIYELMTLSWHSESSQRPGFRDIVLMLIGSEKMVLNIPEEDSSTNPLAGVLGAPLEAGENMYSQLQNRYSRSV